MLKLAAIPWVDTLLPSTQEVSKILLSQIWRLVRLRGLEDMIPRATMTLYGQMELQWTSLTGFLVIQIHHQQLVKTTPSS